MTGLSDLQGGDFASTANAVSADGSVVVGQGSIIMGAPLPSKSKVPTRWTEESGQMVSLGGGVGRDSYPISSTAFDVSDDGSVVVGHTIDSSPGI